MNNKAKTQNKHILNSSRIFYKTIISFNKNILPNLIRSRSFEKFLFLKEQFRSKKSIEFLWSFEYSN